MGSPMPLSSLISSVPLCLRGGVEKFFLRLWDATHLPTQNKWELADLQLEQCNLWGGRNAFRMERLCSGLELKHGLYRFLQHTALPSPMLAL